MRVSLAPVVKREDVQIFATELQAACARLSECEANKSKVGDGLRKRLRSLEMAMVDMQCRVSELEEFGGMETIVEEEEEVEKDEEDVEGIGSQRNDDSIFYEGAYVVLQNVKSREELNGEVGILREWHGERGRWQVRLRSEENVLMREENLLPLRS